MQAASELWSLYEDWKRLTRAEGAAIVKGNWMEVNRCQQSKQQLQPRIIRLTEAARAECGTSQEQEAINTEIRQRVNELIQLETENQSSLRSSLEHLEQERINLDQTSSRLRRIHKSYVPAQGSGWNQYS